MSIIKMQRIAVIGLDNRRDEVLNRLMEFGAVELTDQSSKLEDAFWRENVIKDENQEAVAWLEGKLSRAEQVLELIEKYDPGKKPLFKTRRTIPASREREILLAQDTAEQSVQTLLDLNGRLHQTADRINKAESDRIALTPWLSYDLPLEIQKTGSCVLHAGVMPAAADLTAVNQELEETAESVVFRNVNSDKDLHYVVLLVTADREEEAVTLLKQKGFAEVSFREYEGTVSENLERIAAETAALQAEYKDIEAEITRLTELKESIEEYCDVLNIQADREKIRTRLLKTKRTFFMEGWIPDHCTEQAAAILEEMECCYQFRQPEEGEEVPVALSNRDFFVPFESVTEMYSLPDYRGFDPTSIFAAFYAVFFGIMLSDAGYGIIMAVACFVVLKRYDLEGSAYKMIKMFFWCGISTTFWGALFGGWFGDFFQVFAKIVLHKELVIQPIWFNPIDDPMKLLIFSLALGIVHIFIGMGIKAYMQIRDGKWFDAICDEGFWYLLILGLIAWLGSSMLAADQAAWMTAVSAAGKWMSIIGAAGLLLTGGRYNKGIGKITGGLGALYNITSYLSDILSYSRLLALGLATGVIAQVINTMGSLFGDGILGAIILMAIFLVGHTLNFAINALGSYVHSCRLQYIEFFGKFYEDGGEAFTPFRKNTRYIKMKTEE